MTNNPTSGPRRLTFAAASLLTALSAIPAAGQFAQWTGGTGNWDNDALWSTGNEPTVGSYATIEQGVVIIDMLGEVVQGLRVGEFGNGELIIQSGGGLTSDYGYVGVERGGTGTITVAGAGSTWTNTGLMDIKADGEGGLLNILDGAQVSTDFLTTSDAGIGSISRGRGDITVSGSGSMLTVDNAMWIARRGEGSLTVQAGGVVQVNSLFSIADEDHVSGQIAVTGAGSRLTAVQHCYVGYKGNATLSITDGGEVSNTTAQIGHFDLATGLAEIDGAGSSWTVTGLIVGASGEGTMRITNGGLVTGEGGSIGRAGRSIGVVDVIGAGSTWNNTNNLAIGDQGKGTLNISGGGAVTAQTAEISGTSQSQGEAHITGSNSSLIISGDFEIGGGNKGIMTVTAGGAVSSGSATIGHYTGSVGNTVTIAGAGSAWTVNGDLDIARFSDSILNIEAGGQIDVTGDLTLHDYRDPYLNFGLSSPADPLIDVDGNAELDGFLSVALDSGASLSAGDAFTLIDIGVSQTGVFNNASEGDLLGTFNGVGLLLTYAGGDGNDVVAHAAQSGDLDLDDKVAFSDFSTLANNYNGPSTGQTWSTGDFDADGDVAFADFNILANNWGFDANAPAAAQADFDAASAVNAGEAKLIVGQDGSLTIEGGNINLNGYSITSASGLLNPDGDNNANPFTFYISNSATDVTAGNLGTFANVDGLLVLDASINPADLSNLDLVFQFGTASGSITGDVEVVPEPTSLALLGLGGLLFARRRGNLARRNDDGAFCAESIC